MDWRSLDIQVTARGVRADHPIEITRFEFVRVLRQSLEVADSIVTGAGLEDIVERQRAYGGIAARTATADRHALAVDPPRSRQILGAIDAVINVDDAPLAA